MLNFVNKVLILGMFYGIDLHISSSFFERGIVEISVHNLTQPGAGESLLERAGSPASIRGLVTGVVYERRFPQQSLGA